MDQGYWLLFGDEPPQHMNVFRKNGERWEIVYAGHRLPLIKCEYLKHIHHLIGRFAEGKKDSISAIHLQLATGMVHPAGTTKPSKGNRDTGGDGSWEPVADKATKDAYRAKEEGLKTKLALAKAGGRTSEAEDLEEEINELRRSKLQEYGCKLDKKAYGSREVSGQLRNAAKDVSTGIGRCLRKLQKQSQSLYQHFDSSLSPRGSHNAYKPQTAIDWVLD
jgi:hypothetical protein